MWVTTPCSLIVVVFLFPLVWMLLSSFKTVNEVLAPTIRWLPTPWAPSNYATVLEGNDFAVFLKNSAIVAGSVMLINLVFSSMGGYALAKFRFPGRRAVFAAILLIVMVPFQVIMIPVYIVVHNFGWVNTYWGLIIPAAVSGFGVFFMRQTILTLPNELFEAARLDGASELRVYRQILLPLIAPALAALGVLTFLASWNNLLWPLLVVNSTSLQTLPMGLASLIEGQYGVQYNLIMSGGVISAVPVVLLFLVSRRYLMKGVSMFGARLETHK